jgi:hypothetical protein
MYIRKSMRDEEGFIKAMDAIFDKFKEQLAPVRVEFIDGRIVMSTQIEIQAGKLFEPKWHQCNYGELPSFIADKVAMLRTAGQGIDVDGIGKWRGNKLYYVQVSPKQWNQYHEARV